MNLSEARYYTAIEDGLIQCELCPVCCKIAPGRHGRCGVRRNKEGKLYSEIYNRVTSMAVDPIEKKPLYHIHPNSQIFSIGTLGCNLKCQFCQNWQISQSGAPTHLLSSDQAVKTAIKNNSFGISYTYNEPLIWFEYVLETSKLARANGLKNVLVTNGYINKEPLMELLPFIDAMNIDIKSFNAEYYSTKLGANLDIIKRNITICVKHTHIELTNLVIPGDNDSEEEITALVDWIASISIDIPMHFSKYFPNFHYTSPPTSMETLSMAYEIASKKLHYVYLGNVRDGKYSNTYCPNCKNLLIERAGYTTHIKGLTDGKCSKCSNSIKIVR